MSHTAVASELLLLIAVLIVCIFFQHAISTSKLSFLPGSVVTIAVSSSVALFAKQLSPIHRDADTEWVLSLGANFFYFALLPILVFNAGYHIRRSEFFGNWGAILTLALGGTWTCIFLLAWIVHTATALFGLTPAFSWMECIAFGAVLSSTDPVCTLAVFSVVPVDPGLFYLVLGESVLNDAVALTIYKESLHALESHSDMLVGLTWAVQLCVVFILSAIWGYALCIAIALLFRRLDFGEDWASAVCVVLSLAPLSFLTAELLHGSGIVSTFFAGLATRRYVAPNAMSGHRLSGLSLCLESVGFGAEVGAMVIMGLSFAYVVFTHCSWVFYGLLVVACLAVRTVQAYGLLSLVNLARWLATSPWERKGEGNVEPASPQRVVKLATLTVPTSPGLSPGFSPGLSPGFSPLAPQSPRPASPAAASASGVQWIPLSRMHVVWLAGLRGALNFALAALFPVHTEFVMAATAAVILSTVGVLGALTLPMVRHLKLAATTAPPPTPTSGAGAGGGGGAGLSWESLYLESWVVRGAGGGGGEGLEPLFSRSVCCYQAMALEDLALESLEGEDSSVGGKDHRV